MLLKPRGRQPRAVTLLTALKGTSLRSPDLTPSPCFPLLLFQRWWERATAGSWLPLGPDCIWKAERLERDPLQAQKADLALSRPFSHSWDEIPDISSLKMRFILPDSFRGFSHWLMEGPGRAELVTLWSREVETEGRSWGGKSTLWGHVPSDEPLLTQPHLLTAHWAAEHICGRIHSWAQNASYLPESLHLSTWESENTSRSNHNSQNY